VDRDMALRLKKGDKLAVIPLWNQTEPRHKIQSVIEVTELRYETSQTCVQVKVICKTGQVRWLDAGWFTLENSQLSF